MNEFRFDERIISILGKCEDIEDATEYYRRLKLLSDQFKEDESLQFLQRIFEVLGNFDRLIILNSLKAKDRCSCELEAILQKSQPAISRDLKLLEDVKLIQGWKKGKFIHYSLVKPTFSQFNTAIRNWLSSSDNWFEDLFTT